MYNEIYHEIANDANRIADRYSKSAIVLEKVAWPLVTAGVVCSIAGWGFLMLNILPTTTTIVEGLSIVLPGIATGSRSIIGMLRQNAAALKAISRFQHMEERKTNIDAFLDLEPHKQRLSQLAQLKEVDRISQIPRTSRAQINALETVYDEMREKIGLRFFYTQYNAVRQDFVMGERPLKLASEDFRRYFKKRCKKNKKEVLAEIKATRKQEKVDIKQMHYLASLR